MNLDIFAHNAYHGGALLALFELGPVATLLLIPGLRRLWNQRRDEVLRVVALVLLSAVFAARIVPKSLIGIFMLYALAPLGLVAALGLEAVAARWTDRGPAWSRKAVLVPALAVLAMVPPHALRLWAYQHPIPPGRWQVMDEDGSRPMYLLWRLHEPYQYRDFVRASMNAIPDSSLVVGAWRELPMFYYFRYVEHARPDLALQPCSYPQSLVRIRIWQEQHDLARTPVVFLTLPPDMTPHIVRVDSLQVTPRHWIYFFREPLRGLPAGDGNIYDH